VSTVKVKVLVQEGQNMQQ